MAKTEHNPKNSQKRDFLLLTSITLLLVVGFVLTLATGPDAARRFALSDPHYFSKRQFVFASLALFTYLMLCWQSDRLLRRMAFLGSLVSLLALIGVLAFGKDVNGAQRWLSFFGIAIQPSEIAKPLILVSLAWIMSRAEYYKSAKWMAWGLAFVGITVALILVQPDVGQAFLLTISASLVIFSFGIRLRYLIGLASASIAALGALYFAMPHVHERINAFLGVSQEPPYQIQMALNAIGGGGIFGTGPGNGVWKSRLPDAHTDFVFAVLSEEFGLVGACALIGLYGFIVVRLLIAAATITDSFRRAAISGLVSVFALQIFINIGVNLAILPAKGMTLPFVSYGGSSMLGIALTLGLASAFAVNARGDH